MKRRSSLLWCAVLILAVAAASFSFYARARIKTLREATAHLEKQSDTLARLILGLSARTPGLAGSGSFGGGTGGGRPAGAAANAHGGRRSAAEELIAGDAGLRAAYLKAHGQALPVRWGLLFQILGLTPDQVARFEELQQELTAHELQAYGAAAERRVSIDDPQIQAMEDDLDNATKSELRQLLGPDGYAAYRTYRHEDEVVPIVQELAAYSDSPLSVSQAAGLLQVLSAASERTASGEVIKGTVNLQAAIPQASALLNGSQLATLTEVVQAAQAQHQINLLSDPP